MWKVPEIMATMGPTMEKPGDIRRAIEEGARWFRLPCGYRQRPHLENSRNVRAASAELGVPVQLLMDLPSSRPRTGAMQDLLVGLGTEVLFWDPEVAAVRPTNEDIPAVPLPGLAELLDKLAPGQRMWFCDGRLEYKVAEVVGQVVRTHLIRGVIALKASNAICLPDAESPYVIVTSKDRALLQSFAAAGLIPDWVALSLISSPEDMRDGRREVCRDLGADVKMMAKFETTASLECIEAILAEFDGMMVARGDLGPAVEFIGLPEAQERLVAASRQAGKVAVVATQILESFVETGLPQRPELSDLSLMARQRTDVMMLGKETVYSPRPVEAIRLAREVLTYETRRLEKALTSVPRSLAASLGRPYVVAIEGPDGTGKSPLSKRLGEGLGLTVVRGVPQAWDDPTAKLRMIRDADWLASAMYFLSGVIEASRQLPRGEGPVTIMDRSVWSTLAVHYAHDPARMEILMPLVALAAGRIKVPDLTIVLEASPATCRQRVARKVPAERQFDLAAPCDDGFQLRQREFYRALGQQWPRMAFVDTDGRDFEAVYEQTAELVRTMS